MATFFSNFAFSSSIFSVFKSNEKQIEIIIYARHDT